MPQPAPRAKKSLGQHFLRDPNIARKIVDLLHISAEDRVIEIGPGAGALSGLLGDSPARQVVLLEKDPYWARERQKAAPAHVRTLLMDALHMAWERITPEYPWKIVGNLPYNIASPLLWEIVCRATGLARAVFMVQREVCERICARPGGKSYGALGAWVQSFALPRREFVVSPGAFCPPPRVESAVFSLTLRPRAARPAHPDALARALKWCFQHRRKQLGTVLRQRGFVDSAALCARCALVPTQRPETLSPADFQRLAAFFIENALDFPQQT